MLTRKTKRIAAAVSGLVTAVGTVLGATASPALAATIHPGQIVAAPTKPAIASPAGLAPHAHQNRAADVVTPYSTMAAVCYGSSCNGLDPHQTGCDRDATKVGEAAYSPPYQGYTIQLRYSAACAANWALIIPAPVGWQFYVKNAYGTTQLETVRDSSYGYWFGNMVNGTTQAIACFQNGPCTGWR